MFENISRFLSWLGDHVYLRLATFREMLTIIGQSKLVHALKSNVSP